MNEAKYDFDTHGKKLKPNHIELFEWLNSRCCDSEATLENGLVLYSSPRCGSTLFSDTLNNTRLLGYCEEWFNYEYFAAWSQVTGMVFSLPVYLEWLRVRTGQPFALKIHAAQVKMMWDHFQFPISYLKPRHEVYLYRRNKVAQAVSLAKAVATNQFRHNEEMLGDEKKIDAQTISHYLDASLRQDAYAHIHLVSRCAAKYAYEDYQNDWSIYDSVILAMGKTPPNEYVTSMKRQANKHSEEMISLFLRYITGDYS